MTEGEKILIDRDRAIELLEQAVAEKGADYTNGGCFYVAQDDPDDDLSPLKPGCLVGHALFYAGVPLSEMMKAGNATRIRVIDYDGQLPIELTLGALQIFETAQDAQDTGWNWGTAVNRAKTAEVY